MPQEHQKELEKGQATAKAWRAGLSSGDAAAAASSGAGSAASSGAGGQRRTTLAFTGMDFASVKEHLPHVANCKTWYEPQSDRGRVKYPGVVPATFSRPMSIGAAAVFKDLVTWAWEKHSEATGQMCPYDL